MMCNYESKRPRAGQLENDDIQVTDQDGLERNTWGTMVCKLQIKTASSGSVGARLYIFYRSRRPQADQLEHNVT